MSEYVCPKCDENTVESNMDLCIYCKNGIVPPNKRIKRTTAEDVIKAQEERRKNMKNTITEHDINLLMDKVEISVSTHFNKCTVVSAKFESGFVITESSACVDPENYNEELGKNICIGRIRNKLWELEGYHLQKSLFALEKLKDIIKDSLGDDYEL